MNAKNNQKKNNTACKHRKKYHRKPRQAEGRLKRLVMLEAPEFANTPATLTHTHGCTPTWLLPCGKHFAHETGCIRPDSTIRRATTCRSRGLSGHNTKAQKP